MRAYSAFYSTFGHRKIYFEDTCLSMFISAAERKKKEVLLFYFFFFI